MSRSFGNRTHGDASLRHRVAALGAVRKLWRWLWEIRSSALFGMVVARILRAPLPLARLWLAKLIIDMLIHGRATLRESQELWILIGWQLALTIIGDFLSRLKSFCDGVLGDSFNQQANLKVMRHATALDLAALEDAEFQDRLERARKSTAGRIGSIATLLDVCQDGLSLLCMLTGFIMFSPMLLALLVCMIPAFLGETRFSRLRYRLVHRRTADQRKLEYLSRLGTSVSSAKEVKAFGLGEHLAQQYELISARLVDGNRRIIMQRATVGFLLELISTGGFCVGYVDVLLRTLSGQFTVGAFTFLAGSFWRCRAYMESILTNANTFADQILYLKDLFDFLETQPRSPSATPVISAPRPLRQGLEFRKVSFAYPGSGQPVLQNISFRLTPGEKVALVGRNGSGKTTIVKLLMRFYDPTAGQILLDGTDLRNFDVDELRKQIGVVFQDYVRYNLSARDNVAFGKIERLSDQRRIEDAASKSYASRVIQRFPNGYEQILGRRFEGGVDLSVGEWQAFALARAYMADAQIVVLDEPTASLDARAEYEACRRFTDLAQGRLALMISHRFAAVRTADRILVLANGIAREEGTHEQLMAQRGQYAELFGLQAASFR